MLKQLRLNSLWRTLGFPFVLAMVPTHTLPKCYSISVVLTLFSLVLTLTI